MKSIATLAALASGLLPSTLAHAQSPAPITLALNAPGPSFATFSFASTSSSASSAALPEAPAPAAAAAAAAVAPVSISRACRATGSKPRPGTSSNDQNREPCASTPISYNLILDHPAPAPLSPGQKAHLAFKDITDPANVATIVGNAAVTVATNAHTAYGPGWRGLGSITGYSFLQDATGETFGTFLIPSLTHQDPRYRRMPTASVPRRALHAVASTVLAKSDDGRTIPNYSALLTNPICAELSNLYVPGVPTNGPSTVARIATGYAMMPADNLITEFLPDVARHVHVRVLFVQRILNQISHDPTPAE